MSDNNNNQNSSDMDFGEDLNNANNGKKWSENLFEKEDNPFSKTDSNQTTYNFSNEKIDANRKQNKSLAGVLLVLLIGIGAMIAAVIGLMNKDLFKGKQTPTEAPISAEQTQNTQNQSKTKDLSKKESDTLSSDSQSNAKAKLSAGKYCKLRDAQKYITQSVSDLDKVLSLLEGKIKIANSGTNSLDDNKIAFYKSKLEEVSRAEAEIRDFSEPHLDKDLSVSYKPVNSPCKVADGPKYLYSWLEEIKTRMDALNGDLENVYASPDAEELASMTEEEEANEQNKSPQNLKISKTANQQTDKSKVAPVKLVVNSPIQSETKFSAKSPEKPKERPKALKALSELNSKKSNASINNTASKDSSKGEPKKVLTKEKNTAKTTQAGANGNPKAVKPIQSNKVIANSSPSSVTPKSNLVLNESVNNGSQNQSNVALSQQPSSLRYEIYSGKTKQQGLTNGQKQTVKKPHSPRPIRRCDSYAAPRSYSREYYYDDYEYECEAPDYYYYQDSASYCD
ncbi:MAG: hypothetical protein SFU25_11350 [Candidatus Caenarcaniphilales bacterium]|nr:hypothetical protein [Candidatus Caenarcaniphilales bacterium]